MNDRAVGLLEQYDIEVLRTRKGRGAILCDTNQGCLIFKEYIGSEDKIRVQDKLLGRIADMGRVRVERIIPSKDGQLFVKDGDGICYILKTYFEGRECNIYDRTENSEAVRILAMLHSCMELPAEECSGIAKASPLREYEKHNKELKKVRRFLKQKSQKSWFEISLQHNFDYFLNQALDVAGDWQTYSSMEENALTRESLSFCHGDYQYHNIIRCDKDWCIINFEKCMADNPIRDLYLLMRKLLEKSNWSITLGKELLAAYDTVRPVSAYSRIDLYYRLAYPEKFWKIVNFYYNSGKAWIPERNLEKLEKLLTQEKEKQQFLDAVFRELHRE